MNLPQLQEPKLLNHLNKKKFVNYLSVEAISKAYGTKRLFEKISFGLNQGQRMGLIAKNGTGKSTLLRIITGEETADEGKVTFRNDITVTYLNPCLGPVGVLVDGVLKIFQSAVVIAEPE